jgi:1,2-diacylglycerol 3-beta-glucosyltransferase
MLAAAVLVVIGFSLAHTFALFVLSRRRRRTLLPAPSSLFFVFVIPCLNEERVIGRSLERLLASPADNFAVLVINDDSDDGTEDILSAFSERDPRMWVLTRRAPDARTGKGDALNAAYRYLRDSGVLRGRRPQDVVMTVIDADGRLAANAMTEVAPYFRDPRVGAVQIGVRMYNAGASWLARMQDLEFVIFTEVFQRGRQRVGSVGLGGNGQFTRLSALIDLGDAPWTRCLTEDLDLGIRLLLTGRTNGFCPTTYVSQQALVDLPRLLRQRSRWFQGHLQCLGYVWDIFRSPKLAMRSSMDLAQHLFSPVLLLLTALLPPIFIGGLAYRIVDDPTAARHWLTHPDPWLLLLIYGLSFGLALPYGYAYWLVEPEISLPKAIMYAHGYCLYAYIWFPAGWRAVGRVILRRGSWAKTERVADASVPPVRTPDELPAGR